MPLLGMARTWSGHLRDLASGEIFMIWGKLQSFTVWCIYFPTVGWDFKERVAFGFSLIRCSDLTHLTYLLKCSVCMRAHVCVYSLSACPVSNLFIKHYHCNTVLSILTSLPLCLRGHLPSSCQDVQSVNGPLPDGEHFLNIQGKALKVRFYDIITSQL